MLAMYLKELSNIKPELAATYNDLNSNKKMLQYKAEDLETLKSENAKLKENVEELEKTMFDNIVDED